VATCAPGPRQLQQVSQPRLPDPERWLWVDCQGSHDGTRGMEWFIEDLDDAAFADRLARAISGRGAFRRFKDAHFDRPDLMTRWYA
jgi:hypothetical protein